ncbi:MAG: 50S ribosomal protein L13 [Actinobacteria bacterium]|nr:50S ribosomal protein L13 [Actinomycetota bacterium]MCL6105368.1 50S ribosomal protein L13 [Actinomycetota bacterium]
MKTFSPKSADINRTWHLIDGNGQVLGRLATEVARILMGKHKPIYAPHVDTGDYVIVVNASKIVMTANKLEKKRSWHHSGYPGGIKSISYARLKADKPEQLIYSTVKGMLPRTKLGSKMLTKLKVYAGEEHPHQAQLSPLRREGETTAEFSNA